MIAAGQCHHVVDLSLEVVLGRSLLLSLRELVVSETLLILEAVVVGASSVGLFERIVNYSSRMESRPQVVLYLLWKPWTSVLMGV